MKKIRPDKINFAGLLEKGYMRTLPRSDVEINIRYNVKITSYNIKRNDFLLFLTNFRQNLHHVYL